MHVARKIRNWTRAGCRAHGRAGACAHTSHNEGDTHVPAWSSFDSGTSEKLCNDFGARRFPYSRSFGDADAAVASHRRSTLTVHVSRIHRAIP